MVRECYSRLRPVCFTPTLSCLWRRHRGQALHTRAFSTPALRRYWQSSKASTILTSPFTADLGLSLALFPFTLFFSHCCPDLAKPKQSSTTPRLATRYGPAPVLRTPLRPDGRGPPLVSAPPRYSILTLILTSLSCTW